MQCGDILEDQGLVSVRTTISALFSGSRAKRRRQTAARWGSIGVMSPAHHALGEQPGDPASLESHVMTPLTAAGPVLACEDRRSACLAEAMGWLRSQ